MDAFPVNWGSVPEVMNKEQFFRICHISKSTALHLLKSGKVPCEWSGKKTRCYKIRKEDVKAYLEERAIFPELYSAPSAYSIICGFSSAFTNTPWPYFRSIMWRSLSATMRQSPVPKPSGT